ncbi:type II toxin-antitoxin system toxin ribonuclease C21 [soil metagenome]
MALTALYLADKSALTRIAVEAVRPRLESLLVEGLVATCGVIDLEVGYSARDAKTHAAVRQERRALPRAPLNDEVFDRALEVQGLLAARGHHRLPIPDLLIAASAERAHLTVLHYDADFERISEVTHQPHEWIVRRGTL